MKRYTGLIITLLLVYGGIGLARAEKWVEVGKDAVGFTSHLDTDSLQPVNNHAFVFRIKSVTAQGVKDEVNGVQTGYSLQDFQVDCSERTITNTRIVIYDQQDKVLDDVATPRTRPIEPSTFAAFMADNLCPELQSPPTEEKTPKP